MPLLAKYHRTDGLIRGVWTANNQAMLEAQIVPHDADYGYLILGDQDAQVLQEQFLVVDGTLTVKPAVLLSAVPTTFAADGVTVCTITVTPFVPCTVLVNVTPYALVPEDRVIELTADVPAVFAISLPQQAACWGSAISVEAV